MICSVGHRSSVMEWRLIVRYPVSWFHGFSTKSAPAKSPLTLWSPTKILSFKLAKFQFLLQNLKITMTIMHHAIHYMMLTCCGNHFAIYTFQIHKSYAIYTMHILNLTVLYVKRKWKWSCSVMSDSLQPRGLQPTRLLHPWNSPGSSIHGILQARVLEWVAISFSRGSSQPRDWTWISHIAGRCFTAWATREAL